MSRSFGMQVSWNTDRVLFPNTAPILYNNTSWSLFAWFKVPALPTTGNWPTLFQQAFAYNRAIVVEIRSTNDANNGKIETQVMSVSGDNYIQSASVLDDNAWHRFLLVRRNSSPYTQLYIDGVSEGSSTTDPGTNSDTPNANACCWGASYDPDLSAANPAGWGGQIARCGFLAGTTLTPQDADSFLYTGRIPGLVPSHWLEMGIASPDPDFTSGLYNGTVTGTTIDINPPMHPAFGMSTPREFLHIPPWVPETNSDRTIIQGGGLRW